MYYAYNLQTMAREVTTSGRLSTGAGGFAYEAGPNGCVWFGGAIGGMDLADVPGNSKVAAQFNLGFMCPPGTPVPASSLDITNWQTPSGLLVRGLRTTDVGYTYAVFAYTPAADAVRHDVLVDGVIVGNDNDGSFALSDLRPGRDGRRLRPIGERRWRDGDRAHPGYGQLSHRRSPDNKPGVSVRQITDYSASYPASNANDDNIANTSITGYGFQRWWEIDLGSSQDLSQLEIYARAGAPQQTSNSLPCLGNAHL
ncbi:MAG: hypothetical protein R2706_03565 [Acidimicrobiales bacterium]